MRHYFEIALDIKNAKTKKAQQILFIGLLKIITWLL